MQYRNKRILVISGALLLIVIIVITLIFSSKPKNNTSGNSGQHVDKFSHETISSPPGKAPDQYGTPANKPLYLGFDKLLNYGISSGQLEDVQIAFYRYSQALPSPLKTISVGVDHISTSHDPSNPNSPFDILFPVQFDEDTVYQAKVEYTGLNDVHLYISDQKTGKVIYDSGKLYSGLQSD